MQGDALLSPLLRKEEQEEGRKTEVSDREKLTDSSEDESVKEETEVTEEEEVVLVEKSCDTEEKSSDKDWADQMEEESEEEGKESDKEGICKALYACVARDESELSFEPGSIITKVRRSESRGWFVGTLEGKRGLVPANYVEILSDYWEVTIGL